jgi:Protein of unknown function (DUF4065)
MTKVERQVLRYIPSVAKALEVILWLSERQPGIDVYHVVKSTFYAEKFHITKYGRPVIGDQYRAAWWGPLPQVVYGLLKFEPMEILALGGNGKLPFRVEDGSFRVYGERGPNTNRLSASDIEALEHGFDEVADKTFYELFGMTREDPAYRNARAGMMDYRDFIAKSDPLRKEKIEYLEEVAAFAVL